MHASNDTSPARRIRRLGLLALLVLAFVGGSLLLGLPGKPSRDAWADDPTDVDKGWLVYGLDQKQPTVLRLLAEIQTNAAKRYETPTATPEEKEEILLVVDVIHRCMADPHGDDAQKAKSYAKVLAARKNSGTATSKKAWEDVKADLMHGHD